MAVYTRERVRLAPEHVRRALAMVEAGSVKGRGHEFVCDKRSGLILRVTPTAATFYLKLETTTLWAYRLAAPWQPARRTH